MRIARHLLDVMSRSATGQRDSFDVGRYSGPETLGFPFILIKVDGLDLCYFSPSR
jgi:hypothetical protein